MGFQVEWKLVALSAPYRLKRPDRRFEELKNYTTELQTHINNIIKIRTVSPSVLTLCDEIVALRLLQQEVIIV